jgi:hypothetical protein
MKAPHKSLTVSEAKHAVRLARQAGIRNVSGFFMVGNWGEGIADVLKMWWFVLTNPVDMKLTDCTPLPGTEFDNLLRQNGYLNRDIDWQKVNWVTPLSRTDGLSRRTIAGLYYLTVILVHLPSSLLRGRREKTQGLVRNMFGFISRRFKAEKRERVLQYSNSCAYKCEPRRGYD